MSRQTPPETPEGPSETLPELHLLGKAGAGKTTLFRALTGQGQIGTGFRPQTRQAEAFDLPPEAPVLRLVDHPALELAALPPGAALLAVARQDDPVQAPLAAVLGQLRRTQRGLRVALALTGAERVPDAAARARVAAAIRAELSRAAGGPLPSVELGLAPDGALQGLPDLIEALSALLPGAAGQAFAAAERDAEAQAFALHQPLILRHAAGAGTVDLLPVLGAVGVPAAQAAMLTALARAMGVAWTRQRAAMFASALGAGALARMGAGFALRQGAKLVPVVGQTLGAAAAGAASGALTWALGRAAHAWLWAEARGERMDEAALRTLFARALHEGARRAAGGGRGDARG